MLKIEVKEGVTPRFVGIGMILAGILLALVLVPKPDDSVGIMLLLYLQVFLMVGSGTMMCMDAKNRKLTVEDMTLCYSNWLGRKKTFLLDEIGYCKTALENRGNKDYIRLYDLQGRKLCKLEYNMRDSILLIQYLLDNQITVECSKKSDWELRNIIYAQALCMEEIPDKVNAVYEEAGRLAEEWLGKNKRFGAEWKMGIAIYLEEEWSKEKQLWEQKGYTGASFPEGYFVSIEGYLQKDGQFVMDKKNRAVTFGIPVISISKSWQIGEALKVRFWGNDVLEELSEQLAFLAHLLPRNRYHTESLVLQHALRERL